MSRKSAFLNTSSSGFCTLLRPPAPGPLPAVPSPSPRIPGTRVRRRLMYMHEYGGVYADLDVELLQPLDKLLDSFADLHGASAVLGQEPLAHALLLERQPRQVCNAVLASVRGHPFWLWALEIAAKELTGDSPWDPVGTTGPRMLEVAVMRWQAAHANRSSRVYVTPPDTFYPLWDGGQAAQFTERCAPGDASGAPAYVNDTDVLSLELSVPVRLTCERLRRESFQPALPGDGSAYAAHHWAHTWIDGFSQAFETS
jgi:hypothetical protein